MPKIVLRVKWCKEHFTNRFLLFAFFLGDLGQSLTHSRPHSNEKLFSVSFQL